eukprot:661459-Hanusia_phi.AAC.1
MDEVTRQKEMALNKIRYWLDRTVGDQVCKGLSEQSSKEIFIKTMSKLHREAKADTAEKPARQKAAQEACRMLGVWREQHD